MEGGSSITDIWPVAVQALPKPYVPGSGDRVPAELRLVQGGYVGVACGLFAVALACATAFAFLFLYISLPNFFADDLYIADDMDGLLFGLAFAAFAGELLRGLGWGCEGRSSAQGAYPIFQAAPTAQRSTHGHGGGLEAWRTHTDTRHQPRRVPAPVRGPPRVVAEGRNADAW